jgi:hypothetical protein
MSGDVLLRQAARVAWAIFSGNRGKATSIDLPPLRGVREGQALRGHLPNYVGEEGFPSTAPGTTLAPQIFAGVLGDDAAAGEFPEARDVQDGFSHPRLPIGVQLEQPSVGLHIGRAIRQVHVTAPEHQSYALVFLGQSAAVRSTA